MHLFTVGNEMSVTVLPMIALLNWSLLLSISILEVVYVQGWVEFIHHKLKHSHLRYHSSLGNTLWIKF